VRILPLLGISPILLIGALSASTTPISPLICSDPGSTTASSSDTTIHADSCTDFSYQFPNSPQPVNGTNNWLYGYYPNGINPATFTPMTQQVTDQNGNYLGFWAVQFNRYFTSLDAFGGHPNGVFTDLHIPPFCDQTQFQNCSPSGGLDPRSPNSPDSADQSAVRRYVVPVGVGSTLVDITIQVQKDPRTTNPSAHGTNELVILYRGGVATTLINLADPVNFNPNLPGAPPTPQGIPQPVLTASADNVLVKPGDVIDFVMAPAIDPNFNNLSVDFSAGTFEVDKIQSVPEPVTWGLAAAGLLLACLARRAQVTRETTTLCKISSRYPRWVRRPRRNAKEDHGVRDLGSIFTISSEGHLE
jgi:hypothetical protein